MAHAQSQFLGVTYLLPTRTQARASFIWPASSASQPSQPKLVGAHDPVHRNEETRASKGKVFSPVHVFTCTVHAAHGVCTDHHIDVEEKRESKGRPNSVCAMSRPNSVSILHLTTVLVRYTRLVCVTLAITESSNNPLTSPSCPSGLASLVGSTYYRIFLLRWPLGQPDLSAESEMIILHRSVHVSPYRLI